MPFLRAKWSNLLLLTFAVPDEWVRSAIPAGLEIDRFEGSAHVSLVAFQFRDTRVSGCRIPGHEDFPQVNLRTYVRHGSQRGVVFLRECVPKRLVALVARRLYNEPYLHTPMTDEVTVGTDTARAVYRWGDGNVISVVADARSFLPATDSVEHHFKEHEWGYGRDRRGRLLRYRVEHPPWQVRAVQSCAHTIDFESLAGPPWRALATATPRSINLRRRIGNRRALAGCGH